MTPRKTPRVKKQPPPPTPKQPKPWDVPPLPLAGDMQDSATYEAIGRALSQWEHFEAYFGLIFGVFVGSTDSTPAFRAYGSVLTFKGRLEMMQAASEAFFLRWSDHAVQERFDALALSASNWAARRNEIAHGIVQPYFPSGGPQAGWAVIPSYHATKKRTLGKSKAGQPPTVASFKYAYTSKELMDFAREFEKMATEAHRVYAEALNSPDRALHRQRLAEALLRHQP